MKKALWAQLSLFLLLTLGVTSIQASEVEAHGDHHISSHVPRSLDSYGDADFDSLWDQLSNRVKLEPFNLVATIIFLLAIMHTFLAGFFRNLAHKVEHAHHEKIHAEGRTGTHKPYDDAEDDVSFLGKMLHFFGEIEAIFGIWLVPLGIAIMYFFSWHDVTGYINSITPKYVEPVFVVVIMAIASTRPVLRFAESVLRQFAKLGSRTPAAWWLSILTIAPILGSFITEPAAMTIGAMLLGKQIYQLEPSNKFAYATLGLLFVNVSVGGTLTHFAAPPVLMVAGPWGWDSMFMAFHFGWKAVVGIVIANLVYWAVFKGEFNQLRQKMAMRGSESEMSIHWIDREDAIPIYITVTHLFFLAWTVFTLHTPALFIGGFLFFLAFTMATAHHQNTVEIQGPLLVGFFLAGLITHGSLQSWWIAPVLSSLKEIPLFVGATVLTAFNDNAAITYLASLVPEFDAHAAAVIAQGPEAVEKASLLQRAVVAGAVTGGGLTVIANAPNPAGQFILSKYFKGGIAPLKLLLGALIPTIIVGSMIMFLGS